MNILSPFLALLILLAFSWGVFVAAGKIRAKSVMEDEKVSVYLCGEREDTLSNGKKEGKPNLQPEYRAFFATALLFTIMEVAALFLGTIPKGQGYMLPLAFLGLMLGSVGAILLEVFQSK